MSDSPKKKPVLGESVAALFRELVSPIRSAAPVIEHTMPVISDDVDVTVADVIPAVEEPAAEAGKARRRSLFRKRAEQAELDAQTDQPSPFALEPVELDEIRDEGDVFDIAAETTAAEPTPVAEPVTVVIVPEPVVEPEPATVEPEPMAAVDEPVEEPAPAPAAEIPAIKPAFNAQPEIIVLRNTEPLPEPGHVPSAAELNGFTEAIPTGLEGAEAVLERFGKEPKSKKKSEPAFRPVATSVPLPPMGSYGDMASSEPIDDTPVDLSAFDPSKYFGLSLEARTVGSGKEAREREEAAKAAEEQLSTEEALEANGGVAPSGRDSRVVLQMLRELSQLRNPPSQQ